jgi:hypothetical protein
MRLKLRDEKKKWLVLLLTQKPLRPIGQEVDTIFVFVRDGVVVTIPNSSLVWVRGCFDRVGALPEIQEASPMLSFDQSASASLCFAAWRKMPLADQIGAVARLS